MIWGLHSKVPRDWQTSRKQHLRQNRIVIDLDLSFPFSLMLDVGQELVGAGGWGCVCWGSVCVHVLVRAKVVGWAGFRHGRCVGRWYGSGLEVFWGEVVKGPPVAGGAVQTGRAKSLQPPMPENV